jgi:preprotein translocase subunit SecG
MMLPLAEIALKWHLVIWVWVLVAVALVLVVLIQKGRGGGLAAAFGGSGASSLLGTKTGDFLTWLTIGLVAVWLTLSVVMGLFMRPLESSMLSETPVQQQSPITTSTEQPAAPVTERVPAAGAENSAPVQPAEATPAQPAAETTPPAGTDAPKP